MNCYGVDKIYYYYLRDFNNVPVVTVCVVRKGNEYARGVSICSSYDQVNKNVGRRISRDRALFAIHNRATDDNIINRSEAVDVLNDINYDTLYINYKFEYNPQLSYFEMKLFWTEFRKWVKYENIK